MREVVVKVYSFEELPATAKQVAIENHRDIEVQHDWYQPMFEGFREKATQAGFEVEDIFFSGFWSQGDGAMFEYSRFNENMLKGFVTQLSIAEEQKQMLLDNADTCGKGIHRGMYYHENSCDHYTTLDATSDDQSIADFVVQYEDEFDKYVLSTYKNLCGELYKDLNKYHDELTSDEYVAETLIQNDWEFTEDGNIF